MDSELISWLSNAKKKYLEVRSLVENETETVPNLSKEGPQAVFEPYKDKYKGKQVLVELLSDLKSLKEKNVDKNIEISKRLVIIDALLQYELGLVSWETEEPSVGEGYYRKALEILQSVETSPECCLLVLNVKNQLGILWSERGEPEKARSFLSEAETLYNEYRSKNNVYPYSLIELLSFPDSQTRDNQTIDYGFGKSHVHTLYYLAQVYERLGDAKLAASYCHKTLKWQIEKKNYDPLEWGLNCAMLSQFFVGRDRFDIARYLLSCASFTLATETDTDLTRDKIDEEKDDTLARTKADVARCWTNYGLQLLSASRDRLIDAEELTENNPEASIPAIQSEETVNTEFTLEDFVLIEFDLVEIYSSEIGDKFVLNYEEARRAFLNTQKWANESKIYYSLSNCASDYSIIVQNTSKLYDHLSYFETDNERKCKMHKRRIDMLEELLNALSVTYYLNIHQQILFELGETYTRMMKLKLTNYDSKKKTGAGGDTRPVKKINLLVEKGIQSFQSFLDTLKTKEKKDPEKYADTLVRAALLARFYIAQLYSKFIIFTNPGKRMSNLNEIEKNYNYVKDYVKRNPDDESCIVNELEVFKEMVELIPARLQQEMSATLY